MRATPFVGLLAACLFTSACAVGPLGPLPQGVGFSGIGSEGNGPKDLPAIANPMFASATADADVIPNYRIGLEGQRVSLPRGSIVSSATDPGAQAELAIRNAPAGRPVNLGGQTLSLSAMMVNGTEYAVLRTPKGFLKSRTVRVDPQVFLAEVPRMTGCATEGNTYGAGSDPDRPTGLAVRILCF